MMIISYTYNRAPKMGILFKDVCIGDFFNRHDFMKHRVEVIFTVIICRQKFI